MSVAATNPIPSPKALPNGWGNDVGVNVTPTEQKVDTTIQGYLLANHFVRIGNSSEWQRSFKGSLKSVTNYIDQFQKVCPSPIHVEKSAIPNGTMLYMRVTVNPYDLDDTALLKE